MGGKVVPRQLIAAYQNAVVDDLKKVFADQEVEPEWKAIRKTPGLYSPRIDVAVGPFSIVSGQTKSAEYDAMVRANADLIGRLIDCYESTFKDYQNDKIQERIGHNFPTVESILRFNGNARCFMAIEIENQVSRKHLLGGVVNASVLSRIGILVPWTKEKRRATIKLLQYWDFLKYVGKNTFSADNVLVLTPDQLKEIIIESIPAQ
jgi:hypothetical protein